MIPYVPEIKIIFEPRDLWIGAFIDELDSDDFLEWNTIYICILPMFPIRIRWFRNKSS